jgi:hypothetical protein
LHSSSREQIEPRQNVGCDKNQQANSGESENGPKSGSHSPIIAMTPENRASNAPNPSLQQRYGEGEPEKIQPRNFTDAHRAALYRGEV